MITKFKLFEDWETGIPDIGDKVKPRIKEKATLQDYAWEYLNSQDTFTIQGIKKKGHGYYLIDIGLKDKINEPYYFMFDRFEILKPESDVFDFDKLEDFGSKIEYITKNLKTIKRQIYNKYDDMELYVSDKERLNLEFEQLSVLLMDYFEEYLKLFNIYINNDFDVDDILKNSFDPFGDVLFKLSSMAQDETNGIILPDKVNKFLARYSNMINQMIKVFQYKPDDM